MTIIYLAASWLVGIWLAAIFDGSVWVWLAGGALAAAAAVIFRSKSRARWVFALLTFAAFGAARYTGALPEINPGHVAYYNGRGEEASLVGLVADEPTRFDRTTIFRLRSQEVGYEGGQTFAVEGSVYVTVSGVQQLQYGDRLRLQGRLSDLVEIPSPGFREYLARHGFYSQMNWPRVELLESGGGSRIRRAILSVKERARAVIQRQTPNPQAALLTGILLGDDSGLSSDLDEQFRITGLSHIIAISGFNIAILTGILLSTFQLFTGRRQAAWLALVGVALYTILVGADAAVVRAAIMATLFILATRLLGRPTYAPAGLFTAALLMSLHDPDVIWDVGFQLSFAATLGLMIYVEPISGWSEERLRKWTSPALARRIMGVLSEILLATLAASILVLPIVAYHFGHLSLISPVANLFVLPAQPGVMTWGGLATVAGMILPAAGQVLAWVAWLFLSYTILLVRFFAALPGAAITVGFSPAAVIVIYLLIFSLTWFFRGGTERRAEILDDLRPGLSGSLSMIGGVVLVLLAGFYLAGRPDGKLHVAFLDVGQGDATFIQTPSGRQVLVDGGPAPSLLLAGLGRQMPFWDRSIDVVIVTHPDADHVAGLEDLFGRFQVDRLITNGQESKEGGYQLMLASAIENGAIIRATVVGETISIGDGVRLEVLHPASANQGPPSDGHDNDQSVVVRLVYGDFTLLLTGDGEAATEEALMRTGRELGSVVYKAGHHGANTSSSADFLHTVRPRFIVISAGAGNRFGHPHEEVLQRAADVGAVVLRTDELGTIEVVSDGVAMWWEALK